MGVSICLVFGLVVSLVGKFGGEFGDGSGSTYLGEKDCILGTCSKDSRGEGQGEEGEEDGGGCCGETHVD